MDLQQYRLRRKELSEQEPKYRHVCVVCMQPGMGCYCSFVQKFDPKIKFAILIHPIEVKRRIASGRMSHLCLENSHLIKGQDFSRDAQVNDLLQNSNYHPVVLYPGTQSQNLSLIPPSQRGILFPADKIPLVFVIDGTWTTARKMIRQSQNLISLPRICFTPPAPSNFQVRKQPRVGCYSTLEAIHYTLELIGSYHGFDISSREHDKLLFVFNKMIERQLEFVRASRERLGALSYRRESRHSA